MEQNCIVWSSSKTVEESENIKRVQKVALKICWKDDYVSYENALSIMKIETLKERRKYLY